LDRGRSGISRFQATIDSGGTRSSTSAAYLPAAVFNRPNLSILTSTHVTKLILDNGSVKQVQLGQTKDGQRYYAGAKKEVVVCLGAYGTPQLLLVSGIGGKAETQQAGSEQLVALDGVGRNLKDHIMAGPTYKAAPGTSGQYLSHPVKSVSWSCHVLGAKLTFLDSQLGAVALEWSRTPV
jgi:choline dehydrogenase